MLRLRSNWSVTCDEPSWLEDVISFTPAMRPNWRSRGVATEDAMVSGLAPGRAAFTETDGKSTCGSGETGRTWYATAPERPMAIVRSVVATGRSMNGVEMLILPLTRVRL